MTNTTPRPTPDRGVGDPVDRPEMPQYSVRQILGVWAAATIPMSILSWIITPWLSQRLDGRDPFIDALLICFNIGLLWMIALVLILVRRAAHRPDRPLPQRSSTGHRIRPVCALLQRQLDRLRAGRGGRGACRPLSSTASSTRPIPRGASAAPGWASSPTQPRVPRALAAE